jgi:hypothetical protein
VLFSREDVATFVQKNFEAVWEAVRPVPLVQFDFGNGVKVTRTLNGNIATWVCDADGTALDVLPGIYTPDVYLDRLNQFRLLHNHVGQAGPDGREKRLREYHEGQLASLEKNEAPPRFDNRADISKKRIEGGIKAMLVKGGGAPAAEKPKEPPVTEKADVAAWKQLEEDTRLNETVRRRQVHELLAAGMAKPQGLTKRLYKEVLHCDLDDPYLGLGAVLVGTDPFRGEGGR